jgi:two-component system sensor histidine kinase DegS
MKRIIYALRPRALDEVGLVAALHDLASTQTNCQSTSIRFDVAGTEYMLPDDVELAIYRIAQEALNNSLVHSAANCIEIAITFEAECVRTHVRDNGRGFDAHQIGRGLGLSSMRERAQAIGGSLRIESTMAQGTSVLFELPAKVLHQEPTQCLSVY